MSEDRMKRVRHSVVAFGTTAAIISVIAAGVCARVPRAQAEDWPTHPLTQKLHYSSSGAGGSNHLGCMLLNSTIGIEVTHVPFRNVVQGLQEVMAGRMDYDCVSLPLALPQIEGKTVKPIAILSKTRSSNLPDLPSAHEQGLTNFDLPS